MRRRLNLPSVCKCGLLLDLRFWINVYQLGRLDKSDCEGRLVAYVCFKFFYIMIDSLSYCLVGWSMNGANKRLQEIRRRILFWYDTLRVRNG